MKNNIPAQQKLIHDIFAETAVTYSQKNAIYDGDISLTYQDLFLLKEKTVKYLRSILGNNEKEKMAIFLPNCAEYVYHFLAASEAGFITVPLNTNCKEKELAYYSELIGITAVATNSELLPRWGNVPVKNSNIKFILIDRLKTPSDSESDSTTLGLIEKSADQEVLYLCTSGSTGRPKVIPKTHAPLIAGMKNLSEALEAKNNDVFLAVAPFFHANGFENSMLMPILKGATIVIMSQFSPRHMLETLEKRNITAVIGSPFIFSSLLDIGSKSSGFHDLRICLSAGAPLPFELRKSFYEKFGIVIREHYGSSETGPLTVQSAGSGVDDRSAGRPLNGVNFKIVNDSGEDLPAGVAGDILVRSNSMVHRYLDGDTIKSDSFVDGYFRTGDFGMLDDSGNLVILGRKKNIINAAGVKIDPIEVRNVILSHPKVRDAVVFGEKNRRGLEVVKAIVVAGQNCTVNELVAFCKDQLSDYKIPRVIEFRDSIPVDIMGKPRLFRE